MQTDCQLILVKNLDHSRRFYSEVLGQTTTANSGREIAFNDDLALQTVSSWMRMFGLKHKEISYCGRCTEVYFEEDNFDGFLARLESREDIRYVHGPAGGFGEQLTVRFFDPDGHIIEVSESCDATAQRTMARPFSTKRPIPMVGQSAKEKT